MCMYLCVWLGTLQGEECRAKPSSEKQDCTKAFIGGYWGRELEDSDRQMSQSNKTQLSYPGGQRGFQQEIFEGFLVLTSSLTS